MYPYVYICIHMYTYIHTYIHRYIHTYVYICLHMYTYVYMHACMHAYIHTYIPTYLHTYVYTYIHMCIHMYTHTYICIHINIYIYVHVFFQSSNRSDTSKLIELVVFFSFFLGEGEGAPAIIRRAGAMFGYQRCFASMDFFCVEAGLCFSCLPWRRKCAQRRSNSYLCGALCCQRVLVMARLLARGPGVLFLFSWGGRSLFFSLSRIVGPGGR